jgi:N6-adenosine-specific RNA methylase IME4
VILDFVKDDIKEKPKDYAYNLIETLLPDCNFCEIWGKKGFQRKNWFTIVEK